MTIDVIPCIYCQTENKTSQENCSHCGMPLAKKHPNNVNQRLSFFKKWFWLIVIFCLVMMYYLPR